MSKRGRTGQQGTKFAMTTALPVGAVINCCDNSGAKNMFIIAVRGHKGRLNRLPAASVSDLIVITCKKGKPALRKKVATGVVVRQRQLWRRIDILRCEKAIFLSGMLRASSNSRRKPTLTSLLAVVVPILRLQKSSGHLKCSVSIPKVDESQKSTKRSDKGNHKKKWPILTTY